MTPKPPTSHSPPGGHPLFQGHLGEQPPTADTLRRARRAHALDLLYGRRPKHATLTDPGLRAELDTLRVHWQQASRVVGARRRQAGAVYDDWDDALEGCVQLAQDLAAADAALAAGGAPPQSLTYTRQSVAHRFAVLSAA